MRVAGKWSCRLVLTVVVGALALGVLPGSAAAAEAPPGGAPDQPAQPVMEAAPAAAETSAPVAASSPPPAEQGAPVAASSPPPAEQGAPVADSGGPVAMHEAAQPSTPTAASGEPAARAVPQPSARA